MPARRGIGPEIIEGIGCQQRSGSHQRLELVLIDRQMLDVPDEIAEMRGKPVGEMADDRLECLRSFPPVRGNIPRRRSRRRWVA